MFNLPGVAGRHKNNNTRRQYAELANLSWKFPSKVSRQVPSVRRAGVQGSELWPFRDLGPLRSADNIGSVGRRGYSNSDPFPANIVFQAEPTPFAAVRAFTLYSPTFVERLSGNSYARANRLTMSRIIAA
jgi:hypothetical protein